MTFNLRKWYLDVVDPSGRSAVVYWSALEWGPISVCWNAATLHAGGAVVRHAVGIWATPEPAAGGGAISWRGEAIDCECRCSPTLPAVEASLLPGSDGVTWRCEAPAARTVVRLGGEQVIGGGYAERLELGRLPWRLPIDELRWGRWISDEGHRSVVWIDWRGSTPLTSVYLDGRAAGPARVADDEVSAGGCVLALTGRQLLHERTLGELLGTLVSRLPGIPGGWLALEDRKWLSRGVLAHPEGAPLEGWSIHERIVFP